MSDKNTRLAIELASASDAFEDDEDIEKVIRATLKAQLDSLRSHEDAAERKRAELKADILGDESGAVSDDTDDLSEVEQEQERLRKDILGDD